MLIKKMKIHNFKIYKDKEFDFGNYSFILVSGSNGFGKTTMFDAIEWCLTGNIGRINYNYYIRNTSKPEINRVENKKGIIKNMDCNSDEKIKVELTLDFKGTKVIIFREQFEDDLSVETELQFVNEVPDNIMLQIINLSNNDYFYNYHVCDTLKSFQFLSTNRKDLKSKFNDFIRPYTRANNVKLIMETYNSSLAKDNNKLENKKTVFFNKKEDLNSSIKELKTKVEITEYPKTKFYLDEDISISENNNLEILKEQKKTIKKCGYNRINQKLENIIIFYESEKNKVLYDELLEMTKELEEDIQVTIKNSYYDESLLNDINGKIKEHTDIINEIEKANISTDIEIQKIVGKYKEEEALFKLQYKEINELENQIKEREKEIATREKGNSIITALSNLVTDKKGLLEYKKEGYKACPLCGSQDQFKDIEQVEEIAVEAENYLNKSNTDLVELKNKVKDLKEDCRKKLQQFKEVIVQQAKIQLEKLDKEKQRFNKYYIKTKDFFEKISETSIEINESCINNIKVIRSELNTILLNRKIIYVDLKEIRNISNSLELDIEMDIPTLVKLYKLRNDIRTLGDESIELLHFTYEDFNRKLIYLNHLINNHELNVKTKELNQLNNEYKELSDKIEKNKKHISSSKSKADSITKILNRLEDSELSSVGPYLYKIFIKLIKNTNNIEEIKLETDRSVRGERGAVFVDDKGNNIMNILSQGQLGVFMISYFIANIFKRQEETDFKSYFVDDITNVLDDMNVMSFIELIKYQLDSENGVINQFFFSTSDEDIEKLFIHKMESFNIDWINFKFNSYSKCDVKK